MFFVKRYEDSTNYIYVKMVREDDGFTGVEDIGAPDVMQRTLPDGLVLEDFNDPVWEEVGNGVYRIQLNRHDVPNVGVMTVHVEHAGCRNFDDWGWSMGMFEEFMAPAGRVPANIKEIDDDVVAAVNLEADYDGTGYNKANSTIGTCTTNTDMRGTDNANTVEPDAAGVVGALIAALNDLSSAQVQAACDTAITANSLIVFIKNIAEADAEVDTTVTPWQLVLKIKGTDTELVRKNLKDITNNDLSSVDTIVGGHQEPE